MDMSCNTKTSLLNGCHPYITIACVISCFICTVVMIWGVYAMRSDMQRMEMMMSPTVNTADPMIAHCQSMPEMVGCEKYR